MKVLVSDRIRRVASTMVEAALANPARQTFFYQDSDTGYGNFSSPGQNGTDDAGHHMNPAKGLETDPNDPFRNNQERVQPLIGVRDGRDERRDEVDPSSSFHTDSVYASSEKGATAPWGDDYSRPRDGGLGTYWQPATLPSGMGPDPYDLDAIQPRNQGAPTDHSPGEEDSKKLFDDRAEYPIVRDPKVEGQRS